MRPVILGLLRTALEKQAKERPYGVGEGRYVDVRDPMAARLSGEFDLLVVVTDVAEGLRELERACSTEEREAA